MKHLPGLILTSCILALTACGFHLRGTVQLPPGMSVTFIQDSVPASSIARPLRERLQANGARVTGNLLEATAVLRIGGESFDRRLQGTGLTSKQKQYELSYSVVFAANAKDNVWSVNEQRVTVTREMMFDEEQVLAKTAEQEQLQQAMVQDAAGQILARLRTQAK